MQRSKMSKQVKDAAKNSQEQSKTYDGNTEQRVSTGSTLLDLAISGGRSRGGGIPGGIVMEIFGQSSLGKTSLLCEIAGGVQRQGGEIKFKDPESRLSTEFAQLFGVELDEEDVGKPETPVDIFKPMRQWNPTPQDKIHGQFVDSSAALISDLEQQDKKDEYQRRAKLFSQELRKTCRYIEQNNWLICATNQVRQNVDGMGEKYSTPGGEAFNFYASLRLKLSKPSSGHKIMKTINYKNKEIEEQVGVVSQVQVYKSSVWKSARTAQIYLIWDYGIDDVRANLQWLKSRLGTSVYTVDGEKNVGQGLEKAIQTVEQEELEEELRETVIDTWEDIENKFKSRRKSKKR